MTAVIRQVSGDELKRLISPEIAGTLSEQSRMVMCEALSLSSMVWVGMDDDEVLGFWGLVLPSLISDRAYLWLYATPALEDHRFVFVRHSQIVVREMLKDYPLIVGHCVKGERKSIRWLKWLGAEFKSPEGHLVPFEIKAA